MDYLNRKKAYKVRAYTLKFIIFIMLRAIISHTLELKSNHRKIKSTFDILIDNLSMNT